MSDFLYWASLIGVPVAVVVYAKYRRRRFVAKRNDSVTIPVASSVCAFTGDIVAPGSDACGWPACDGAHGCDGTMGLGCDAGHGGH